MDDFTQEFVRWMNEEGLDASQVASALSVSPQAVYNWRSTGIPPRRQKHVQLYMAEAKAKKNHSNMSGQNLVLHPSDEQFRNWGNAAAKEGKNIIDWAFDGLESLAAEQIKEDHPLVPLSMLAEQPDEYHNKGDKAAG